MRTIGAVVFLLAVLGSIDSSAAVNTNQMEVMRRAASMGNADAKYRYAWALVQTKEPLKVKEAIDWMETAARGGNTNAMLYLAGQIQSGRLPGGRSDMEYWYGLAAKAGNADAWYQWGKLLEYDHGRANAKSVQCYAEAAKRGSWLGKYALETAYGDSLGKSYNPAESGRLAVELGHYAAASYQFNEAGDPIKAYQFARVEEYVTGKPATKSAQYYANRMSKGQIEQGDKLFWDYVKQNKLQQKKR